MFYPINKIKNTVTVSKNYVKFLKNQNHKQKNTYIQNFLFPVTSFKVIYKNNFNQ